MTDTTPARLLVAQAAQDLHWQVAISDDITVARGDSVAYRTSKATLMTMYALVTDDAQALYDLFLDNNEGVAANLARIPEWRERYPLPCPTCGKDIEWGNHLICWREA